MPTLEELYQHSLWMTLPLFFIALAGLISAIRSPIRLQRQSQLFSIPLIEQQDIEFNKAEPVVLCLRGPRC